MIDVGFDLCCGRCRSWGQNLLSLCMQLIGQLGLIDTLVL